MSNYHKKKLKCKWFVLKKWIIYNFELWFLSLYAMRSIKPGKSFISFNIWTFSCEDLFAKQIFQDPIYNLGNSLLTLLPIK